jgi:hypothetical protein
MGRGLLLWLIGIPIPIILVVWLLGGLHGLSSVIRSRSARVGGRAEEPSLRSWGLRLRANVDLLSV